MGDGRWSGCLRVVMLPPRRPVGRGGLGQLGSDLEKTGPPGLPQQKGKGLGYGPRGSGRHGPRRAVALRCCLGV